MQSAVNLYSNSQAFEEDFALQEDQQFLLGGAESTMDDFALIDTQNESMKDEIEAMEKMFSQTDSQFFEVSKAAVEMEN